MSIEDTAELEPDPLEIEPCELCGCAIEDLEELIYLHAADLVAQWERADPRDNWRHTGEHPPRSQPHPPAKRQYQTPQSTIDAFWYVVLLDDADHLARWLAKHPADAPALIKLWEGEQRAP
jgi:hypothetical protein